MGVEVKVTLKQLRSLRSDWPDRRRRPRYGKDQGAAKTRRGGAISGHAFRRAASRAFTRGKWIACHSGGGGRASSVPPRLHGPTGKWRVSSRELQYPSTSHAMVELLRQRQQGDANGLLCCGKFVPASDPCSIPNSRAESPRGWAFPEDLPRRARYPNPRQSQASERIPGLVRQPLWPRIPPIRLRSASPSNARWCPC